MSYLEQKELESTYMMTTYGRKPVEFVRGKGMHLYDSEGKEYLDFLSGIGVVCLGHSHPVISDAIAAQAQKLIQVGNYFYVEGRGELARDISLLLNNNETEKDPWKLFFSNSGAEANEGALKLARKYGKLHLEGAGTVITLKRSFHGRTLATTAATGQAVKQESFTPMPSGFVHAYPNDEEDLISTVSECSRLALENGKPELAACALMIECIQGEGGVWPLSDEYIKFARKLTKEQGMLLIVDEVQTGFYRTGKAFSYQHAGIRPDVVSLAKGIANGFPCAAVAATGAAADVLVPGEHGSTYGGNPLAVAAANATISELKGCISPTRISEIGTYFKEQLSSLPHVTEVRGRGLMLGASLDVALAQYILDAALERGIIMNAIGNNLLRFLPPLIVSKDDIDTLCSILRELLDAPLVWEESDAV